MEVAVQMTFLSCGGYSSPNQNYYTKGGTHQTFTHYAQPKNKFKGVFGEVQSA